MVNPDQKFKSWLSKEIKHISNNAKDYSWISYQDASAYRKNNSIVIWSIEEDDPAYSYFITHGKYKGKLKVDYININNNETIEAYIKKKYPGYRRTETLDKLIEDTVLST